MSVCGCVSSSYWLCCMFHSLMPEVLQNPKRKEWTYFLRLCISSTILQKKVHVFPWNLLQKMPRKSSLFVALGECHFSTSWWHLLGKSQPACDEPWMNKHNATRGTIEKSTMANIPHVNCDCTEHWLHLTIRHSNELGVSLKGSKSSDRGKIIHQVCTESHSYKARHGNESLCKNVRSLN